MKCRRKKSRLSGIFQATAKASHRSHSKALVQMRLALNVIGNRHRQIGNADTGGHIACHQQFITAQAVFAAAFLAETAIGTETGRRRNHRPVDVTMLRL